MNCYLVIRKEVQYATGAETIAEAEDKFCSTYNVIDDDFTVKEVEVEELADSKEVNWF